MAQLLIPIGISLATSLAGAAVGALFAGGKPSAEQRLNDLTAPKSRFGQQIPWVWGSMRVGENVIWHPDIEEVEVKRKSGGKGGRRTTGYDYFVSFAALLCRGPVAAVPRIWLNFRLVVDLTEGASDEVVAASKKFLNNHCRIYLGDDAQLPDPLMQADVGIERSPAYRGLCVIVIERLPLADYGNNRPTLSALVSSQAEKVGDRYRLEPVILGDIVSDICREVGFDAGDIDVSELTDEVHGFWINTAGSAKEAIENLMLTYRFGVSESANGIRFRKLKRNEPPELLQINKMGAHPYGSSKPVRYQETRVQESELPRSITVVYPDPNVAYREGSQSSPIKGGTRSRDAESITLPVAMNASQAKTLADIDLFLAWTQRRSYEMDLPIMDFALETIDLVQLPFVGNEIAQIQSIQLGADLRLRVTAAGYQGHIFDHQATVIQPYIVEFEGTPGETYSMRPVPISEWSSLRQASGTVLRRGIDYTISQVSGDLTISSEYEMDPNTPMIASFYGEQVEREHDFGLPGDASLQILDIPAIADNDPDYGIYVAATGGERWRGADLYAKGEQDPDYELIVTLNRAAVGSAVTALQTGSHETIDYGSTVRVLIDFTLDSITRNQLLHGANMAMLGDEMIAFQNAQKVGQDLWELSTLIRGMRGTQHHVSGHSIGERFVLLDTAQDVEADVSQIDQTVEFKAVSGSQTLDDIDPVSQYIAPERARPYAPQILRVNVIGSGHNVTWARCDRKGADRGIFAIKPMSEATERYRVQLVRGSDIVAEYTVNGVSNRTVPNAVSGDKIRVMQVSQDVGNGYFSEVTV